MQNKPLRSSYTVVQSTKGQMYWYKHEIMS